MPVNVVKNNPRRQSNFSLKYVQVPVTKKIKKLAIEEEKPKLTIYLTKICFSVYWVTLPKKVTQTWMLIKAEYQFPGIGNT